MAKKKSNLVKNGNDSGPKPIPRSIAVAEGPLKDSREYAALLAASISDTVRGLMAPPVLTATCNGVGKLLKMVELQQKYGGGKPLRLA